MKIQTSPGHAPTLDDAHASAGSPVSQPELGFLTQERSDHEYRDAVRHSKRVRLLKIAMPVVGGLIILGLVATLAIRQFLLPGIDLGAIGYQDGKLVMENPNLNGFDKDKRPFKLSADRAIQNADQPRRVELVNIAATLPMDDTRFAEITAGNGVYDAEQKTLVLSQQIHVNTTDGMKIDLGDADVDIGKGSLKTPNPVFASTPQADISADSLLISDSGEQIVFEGTVRLTLRPKESNSPEAKNE